ncbi:MAG: M20/M25/M40 family metallo-hydrolase [Thiovulaceae bacterium]|nr:M20/M25/M40 family metallo-hydrolase [Sulfurimonadaceae bacterium]
MNDFWKIFETIVEIPRCSGDARAMGIFIEKWIKDHGYSLKVDKTGNVLATHPDARVTLQAHYDMVCLGKAPDIKLIHEKGKIKADKSTLGADNGIGVAMMLEAMQMGLAVDCLFTTDEEIGLIGANNLELKIKTAYVLNLDSEEEESVFIGCAGGVDMQGRMKLQRTLVKKGLLLESTISNLPGGHSGLEIDKKIPNANIELAKRLTNYQDIKLISIEGGERRNSIPKAAKARFIASSDSLDHHVKELGQIDEPIYVYEGCEKLLSSLALMPHGVKQMNKQYNIPQSSLNFASMKIVDDILVVDFSLRAMDMYSMDVMVGQTVHQLEAMGFTVRHEEKYPAWAPIQTEFATIVGDVVKEVEGFVEYKAIHAGLECGVLQRKAPKIEFASIGPNIGNAHTTKEYVEKRSCESFREIVLKVINEV